MSITDELKSCIENVRSGLKANERKVVVFSETGPANMSAIEAIVKAIASLESRVEALERANSLKT